jgi:hypothetical protein
MISFFRKVWQKLLQQNQVTRCLSYALEEIILVTLGILIAVQVHNWNENCKARTFEVEIFSLINENLIRDSAFIAVELQIPNWQINFSDSILR